MGSLVVVLVRLVVVVVVFDNVVAGFAPRSPF
jgi:hypothetical protein